MGTNASRLVPLFVGACVGVAVSSAPAPALAQGIICCNRSIDVGGDWIGAGDCDDLARVSAEKRAEACKQLVECPPAQPYCGCSEPWPPGCPCAAGEVHNYSTGACIPDPCAGRSGVMHWPTNNRCVPDSCNQPDTGRNLVRDAQGNCVPRTGSCDEPGARRNPNGACVASRGPASGSDAGRSGGSAGTTDWSQNPIIKKDIEDSDTARRIWNYYEPGKGYGPYQWEYPPSGGVSVCQENPPPDGTICVSAPEAPNPVGPDSGVTVRCTHDGTQWRCVEVPNSP